MLEGIGLGQIVLGGQYRPYLLVSSTYSRYRLATNIKKNSEASEVVKKTSEV